MELLLDLWSTVFSLKEYWYKYTKSDNKRMNSIWALFAYVKRSKIKDAHNLKIWLWQSCFALVTVDQTPS